MDCEKFDQHVIDALYDELDELTMAAMKRHMESCPRCASAFSALRATREVAVLPLEEPSEELESRILFAASAAQRKTPWHKKALRGLAWAGSHAMRPQLAMAAVFVLVIGSSLLLLRAKPGTTAIGPVRVTERGEPSPDRDDSAQAAAVTAAPAAQTAAPQDVQGAPPPPAAVAEVAQSRSAEGADEAKEKDGKGAKSGGDAQTALADAKSTEGSLGCDAALPKYDDVGVRFSGTPQAAEAMWAAANCHKKRGETNKARELYGVLAKRDDYKDKAAQALNETAPVSNMAVAAAPASTAPPPASAAATAAPVASASVANNQAPAYGGRAGANAAPMPAPAPPRMAPAGGPRNAAPAKAPAYSDADAKSAPGGGGTRRAAPEKQKMIDSAL